MTERSGKVGVLMGGRSAERAVSLRSGKTVMDALSSAGVDAIAIDVGNDLPRILREEGVTRVFNVLHGRGGEDGQLQGLLGMMDIPVTGSGLLASALAMDKLRCKQMWRCLGLPTPDFHVLTDTSDWAALIEEYGEMVVKPAHEGSSIGMSMVDTPEQLHKAFTAASRFDSLVMAEKRIRGREFTVTILDGRTLPVIELHTDREFYDYDAKYVDNDTRYICPADLTGDEEAILGNLCLDAFNAIGCSGWGRVDVMRDEAGAFFLLEVNTVPGMTDHSLVPMAAREAGMSLEELVLTVLRTAEGSRP